METQTQHKQLTQPTVENIHAAFEKIKEYAKAHDYVISPYLAPLPTVEFDSKRQMKIVRNYINRFEKHITMSQANKFLHFLFKRVYKLDKAPRIEYGAKERKIQEAKKAWKAAQAEANKLLLAYKQEKGDFYKKSV